MEIKDNLTAEVHVDDQPETTALPTKETLKRDSIKRILGSVAVPAALLLDIARAGLTDGRPILMEAIDSLPEWGQVAVASGVALSVAKTGLNMQRDLELNAHSVDQIEHITENADKNRASLVDRAISPHYIGSKLKSSFRKGPKPKVVSTKTRASSSRLVRSGRTTTRRHNTRRI